MEQNKRTTSDELCEILVSEGIDFFVGIPCSLLKEIICKLDGESDFTYIPATREDLAVGIAVGAQLAGRNPMLLMQNSGIGLCLTALTSLSMLYQIPLLMLVTWRGYEGQDSPEHIHMGRVMLNLLDDVGIPYCIMQSNEVRSDVITAFRLLHNTNGPVALILREGVLA